MKGKELIRKILTDKMLFITWTLLMIIVSSTPSKSLPDVGFDYSDKLAHFTEYFIFIILFWRFQLKLNKPFTKIIKNSLIIILIIPLIDELHQLFIPGRDCDVFDVLADVFGLTAGLLFMMAYYYRKRKMYVVR